MVNGVAGQTGLLAVSHAGMVQGRGPECVIIQHLCMVGTIAQDTRLKTKCVVLGDAYLVRMRFLLVYLATGEGEALSVVPNNGCVGD